jgi:D-beta-D-heptose 7-phosphate kinase/D-beta-D-heptose 1-phosphate adenosyltransferase
LQGEAARALVLLGLRSVDAVICFDEDTPAELIEQIQPDVLIKGGDYAAENVAGRETVAKRGGQTVIIPFLEGFSTSAIVEKMINTKLQSKDCNLVLGGGSPPPASF